MRPAITFFFLDGDDLLDRDAVQLLAKVSTLGNLDCLMFEAEAFYEDRASFESNPSFATYYKRSGRYDTVLDGRSAFVRLIENGDYKPSACLRLLRRQFLLDNKVDFIEGILHEDNAFTFEVLHYVSRVSVWKIPPYKRRVHSNSIMTSGRGQRNAYGYYCAIRAALRLSEETCEEGYNEALKKQVLTLVRNARSFSRVANREERVDFCLALPLCDRLVFDLLILEDQVNESLPVSGAVDKTCGYKALERKNKQYEKELTKIKKLHSYRLALAMPKLYKSRGDYLLEAIARLQKMRMGGDASLPAHSAH